MNKTCGECKYYCNDAAFCSHRGVGWKKKTDMICKDFEPKPTNGDVIRQMSNTELANWGMYDLGTCPTFEMQQNCPKCGECSASEIEACWLNWLNAPAKEGGR